MSAGYDVLAISYILIPLLLIPFYLRLLYIFHSKFTQLLSYRLMFHQGIGDIMLMTGQFAAGISASFGVPMPFWVNKIFGAIFNGGYQSSIPFVLLLSLNRFIVICDFRCCRPLLDPRFAPFWVGLPYLWGLMLGISYLCPGVDVLFDLDSFSWKFAGNHSDTTQQIDLYAGEAIIIASTITYICLLGYIFVKKFLLLRRAKAARTTVTRRYNFGLLLNVFFTYASLGLLLLLFHVQPKISNTKTASAVVNMLITLRAGLDPFICLVTIRSVRKVFVAKSTVGARFVTVMRT